MEEREVKQYIIVRTDLGMSSGKLATQSAHACMKVFFDKFQHTQICLNKSDGELVDGFFYVPTEAEINWINGRFTKITKKVKNENQLLKVYQAAKDTGLNASLIKDAGLFGLEGENYTCVAVGPNYVEDCEPIVGKLQLLTNLKTL